MRALVVAGLLLALPGFAQSFAQPTDEGMRPVVPAVVGKPAPNIAVTPLPASARELTGQARPKPVPLAALAADRPVLLIFGSYT